jgi:hypothetical protein
MRLLVLSLVAGLSFTSLAAAQSNSNPAQDPARVAGEHASTPQLDVGSAEPEPLDAADGVCYTMRSYIFKRRGTEAPRLAGMVTCTPSTQRQFKRAKPAPKPRLVPADSADLR